ncbi:MAG: EAL domain-containing protein, partial [Angelakisella sp.]
HIAEQYPKVPVQLYRDTESCLDAIINGQNKWTVLNTMTAERMLKAHEYQNLGANEMTNGEISICFGVPLNADPTLLPVLNKSIAAISDSTRKQIVYEHTISQPYQPTTREILYYNLPAFSVGVIVLLVGLYLFNLYSKKKLNQLAYYDTLTGEMNLNRFKLEAQKLMGRPGRQNAVMVVDIDKFKAINDLYGYEFGDEMLILLAKTLRGAMPSGTILCHGVADKFDCFFEYHGDMWMNERFACLAQAVKQAIAEQMPSCNIVLSAGVCVIQPTDHNIISIIDHANIAAKQIKSYHESSFAFYRQSMSDKINQTRAIENSMSDALQNGEFVVYLQPKIDLATSRIAGAEALVRWQHPRHGIIPPIEFIPLFEENGFIVSLDFYMLEHVCRMLERWKAEGRTLFTVSVNLSRRHLFMADTAQRLSDIVKKYDVNPQFIEVELTESAFDNCDIESINALFYELHRRGFTVSVDDFGAGYSSLSLLKDLSIDVLKIDKSFFDCAQSCATNKMDILLESVISLSRRLNIKTVSEGVETVQQVNLLLQLGCDLVQGYYFARPMPVQQLEQLLEGGDLFGAAEPLSAIPAT